MTTMASPRHIFTRLAVTLTLHSLVALTFAMDIRAVDENTMLGCQVREYRYTVTKEPYTTPDGRLLQCSGVVVVDSCWGRCDSSEIPDYKVPYKLSDHPVCTYKKINRRIVRLNMCDDHYPDPEHEVIDAESCECSYCAAHDTSCQTLNN